MNRSPVMAGRRDASLLNRPNTYDPKKHHVATLTATARCSGRPLDPMGLRPAEDVPVASRCQASGCAQNWPQRRKDD